MNKTFEGEEAHEAFLGMSVSEYINERGVGAFLDLLTDEAVEKLCDYYDYLIG